MALKSNVKDKTPARDRFKREIQLLSKGYFNKTAFPNGNITVFPWDTNIDEWFAAQARKKSGNDGSRMMFDVLPLIANMNGCKVEDFLASEALLVLLVSRSILHGDSVDFEAVCTHCGHKQAESVGVPNDLAKKGEKALDYPGYDEVTLNHSKDVVRLRPSTIGDAFRMSEIDQNPAFKFVKVSDTIKNLAQCLISVNDGKPDDIKEVVEWFGLLHPGDTEQLLAFFDTIQPSLDMSVTVGCESNSCGKDFEYNLRLDADFFRRCRLPGTSAKVGAVSGVSTKDGQLHPGVVQHPGHHVADSHKKA